MSEQSWFRFSKTSDIALDFAGCPELFVNLGLLILWSGDISSTQLWVLG